VAFPRLTAAAVTVVATAAAPRLGAIDVSSSPPCAGAARVADGGRRGIEARHAMPNRRAGINPFKRPMVGVKYDTLVA